MYLSEEVHCRKKAQQAKVCINNGDSTNSFPRHDLHDTVIRPVHSQVKKEYSKEVVGCSRSCSYSKIEADNNIYQADKKQTHKSWMTLK